MGLREDVYAKMSLAPAKIVGQTLSHPRHRRKWELWYLVHSIADPRQIVFVSQVDCNTGRSVLCVMVRLLNRDVHIDIDTAVMNGPIVADSLFAQSARCLVR